MFLLQADCRLSKVLELDKQGLLVHSKDSGETGETSSDEG
jgi:hypothetical protein